MAQIKDLSNPAFIHIMLYKQGMKAEDLPLLDIHSNWYFEVSCLCIWKIHS